MQNEEWHVCVVSTKRNGINMQACRKFYQPKIIYFLKPLTKLTLLVETLKIHAKPLIYMPYAKKLSMNLLVEKTAFTSTKLYVQ